MDHAALPVAVLATRIHTVWRSRRERDGWRFGPHDARARTSPYLKPLDRFSRAEWRRERWLALTDLLAIADEPQCDIARIALSAAAVRRLRADFAAADIDAIAVRIHGAWRRINTALGFSDVRTGLSFDDLSPEARALTRANVMCDIDAIRSLIEGRTGPLRIAPCPDMAEHGGLLHASGSSLSPDAPR